MATLLLVSSNDILPFTIDNLTECTGEEFLSKTQDHLFNKLKWGDAIQIDSSYRNANKFFWDNGWHAMNTENNFGFGDYGILPEQFSVFNPQKNVSVSYFNNTMYYNLDYMPWNPNWFKEELIDNVVFQDNEIMTHFEWEAKKYTIKYHLSDVLGNKTLFKNFKWTHSSGNCNETINYLECTEDHSSFPESAKKYVKEYYPFLPKPDYKYLKNKIEIDELNWNLLDDCLKKSQIGITMDLHNLMKLLLPEILNETVIEDEKNNFIDQIFKSTYLYGEMRDFKFSCI